MEAILTSLLPVFILIGVGYLFQKSQPPEPRIHQVLCRIGAGSCSSWTSILNRYALNLALPGLILSSLISVNKDSIPDMTFVVYTAGAMLLFMGIIVAATTHAKLPAATANAYLFGGFFGNTAYIGFAYLLSLFVNSGAILSLILAIHLIIAFTVGIAILERRTHHTVSSLAIIEKTVKNPLLISVCIGLIILLADIELPIVLVKAIAMIGNSASPIVLIALGTFIAQEWRFDDTIIHATSIALIKLVAMPMLFLLLAAGLIQDIGITLSILEAAMPVALTNFALAETYAINKTMIANAIIVSTVLSVATIPLITWIALHLT